MGDVMNIDMLRVFCSVVEQQSFSAGAALHRISQSAATQAIQRLEEHFGTRLLDRRKRPPMLTPAGEICRQEFRKIIELYDAVADQIRVLGDEIQGHVRVAAIYSVGLYGLGHCMQQFMVSYPKARVQLEYLRPADVYEAVQSGRVDLGIVSYPAALRGLSVIPLRSEEMVLTCQAQHALASRKSVSLAALAGEKFVGFDRDLPIRKEIDRQLRQQGVTVEVVLEFDNIETIKQAVEIGAGISILPEPTVCKEVQIGTLAAIRLRGCSLQRPIGILHRDRLVFSPTVSRFVELLQQMPMAKLSEAG
jgi:DNA-binding transcriptional LysR family regulator